MSSQHLSHRDDRIWILVGDGRTATVYERDRPSDPLEICSRSAWKLLPVNGLSISAPASSECELNADTPGLVFDRAGFGRHTPEPHNNARRMVEANLAQQIAMAINRAETEDRFEKLVVVAPPVWLGQLRPHLSHRVREKITAEIDKAFTNLSVREIAQRLDKILF